MNTENRVYVAGHRGLVGSALVRRLVDDGFGNVIVRTRHELDLADRPAVDAFFRDERPEYVFLAAARVGGIMANATRPAEFIRDNLAIQLNVLDAAHRAGVRKLLFLGSSCVYPKHAPQPIPEEALLGGPLEETNRAYAVAKIAGIEMCRAYRQQFGSRFIAAMPTNVYGPGDDFDPESGHVLPALIRRIHHAKIRQEPEVEVWGTGRPLREFMHANDLADACVFLMRNYDDTSIINVGTGDEVTIAQLAALVAEVVGYRGAIRFDPERPDGVPRKLVDSSRLTKLGWRARTPLREGIAATYRWFVEHETVAAGDAR